MLTFFPAEKILNRRRASRYDSTITLRMKDRPLLEHGPNRDLKHGVTYDGECSYEVWYLLAALV